MFECDKVLPTMRDELQMMHEQFEKNLKLERQELESQMRFLELSDDMLFTGSGNNLKMWQNCAKRIRDINELISLK